MNTHFHNTFIPNLMHLKLQIMSIPIASNHFSEDVSDFEEHAKLHEEEASSEGASSQKSCALCLEPTSDLEKHLIEQHRIAESAIEKFLLTDRTAK